MIQIYADGALIHDSRLQERALLGLETTEGLNKSGTATITMVPDHPAYSSFLSYRTVVEILENRELRFRGRPLYPTDDLLLRRAITCEGEKGFFHDVVHRPYKYQDDPKNIFTAVVELYNSKVEEFKQFVLGEITVEDPNDYILLESEDAEECYEVLDKLVERCGGYIVFTSNAEGKRVVSWLAEVGQESTQAIEFGQNLLDFSRTSANSELATVIVPYGAKINDTTGERLTIASVNDGLDYIQDDAAVALRGRIEKVVVWDDVTTPDALLTKARQTLTEKKNLLTSLEVTAIDLSLQNKDINSFKLGDRVPVRSRAHGETGELYRLTDRSRNLLSPAGDKINLGRTASSLTGADVAANRKTSNEVKKVENVLANFDVNVAKQIEDSEQRMTSLIEQLEDSITLSVSGSIGGTAKIALSVNGAEVEQTLDLSAVRKAFAEDTTAVTIQAGLITFNSGTIVINSQNFRVTADGTITAKAGTIAGWTLVGSKLYAGDGEEIKTVAVQAPTASTLYVFAAGGTSHESYADCPFRVTKTGKLYATDAVIHGDVITIDGSYKTELDRGSLRLYYEDNLCGTINTKYWSGAATEGISLRVEEGGKYIMFSHPSNSGSGYDVDYYLNYGWDDYYSEKHIFQTSARFLDDVYLQRSYHRALYLVNGNGTYLVGVNSSGALTCSKI